MRVLVTGSRNWIDEAMVVSALKMVDDAGDGFHEIVHGDQERWNEKLGRRSGLDRMAARVALRLGWSEKPFPAEWTRLGKGAGGVRNQKMVDYGADICLAFPLEGSVGTWDCMDRASRADIPVVVVGVTGWEEYLLKVLTASLRLEVGAEVTTKVNPDLDMTDWVPWAVANRRDGAGRVIGLSDSHGLMYLVSHGAVEAWYDESEVTAS